MSLEVHEVEDLLVKNEVEWLREQLSKTTQVLIELYLRS
jgi:hypothetical protein